MIFWLTPVQESLGISGFDSVAATMFNTSPVTSCNNSIVDNVIGGWTVGSITAAQTGRNFKLAGGVNTFNNWDGPTPANANGTPAGILNYVPNQNDSGVRLHGISVSQLQSKAGVYMTGMTGNPNGPVSILPQNLFGLGGAIQPSSTPGQLGSIVFLKGPRLFNTDISIIKAIPIPQFGWHPQLT